MKTLERILEALGNRLIGLAETLRKLRLRRENKARRVELCRQIDACGMKLYRRGTNPVRTH